MKEIKETRQQNRARKTSLKVVSVTFTAEPGSEKRLGRLYQVLLVDKEKERTATGNSEPISHEVSEK